MENKIVTLKVNDYGHIKPITDITANEVVLTRVIIGNSIYDKPLPMIPGNIFVNVMVNTENDLKVTRSIYKATNFTIGANNSHISDCVLEQLSTIEAYREIGNEAMLLINSIVNLAIAYAENRVTTRIKYGESELVASILDLNKGDNVS